jgi:hypothetical protein
VELRATGMRCLTLDGKLEILGSSGAWSLRRFLGNQGMLKSFLKRLRPAKIAADENGVVNRTAGLDVAKLKTLTEYFPIGKKLRYFPEFQRDIVFDTLIVAYCVNDRFVYSRDAIETDGNGYPSSFLLGDAVKLPVSKVIQLHLLVPDTSDMEKTLDYHRRAIIGRSRQFIKGNAITLIANAGARGVSTVDTLVAKPVTLKDGPYANHKMILLDPELGTLSVTDQRKQPRARTHVPVDLYLKKADPSCPCLLADFAESSIRLRVRESGDTLPTMGVDDKVILVIDLGESAKTYSIKGAVLRRSADSCVIRLEAFYKERAFAPFNLMDLLELKTGLLNYGA